MTPEPARKRIRRRIARRIFELFQRLGVDVLPRHFYSQVPNIRELRRTTGWRRRYSMRGIEGAELAGQLDFARRCCPPELADHVAASSIHADACAENGAYGYGPVEADFLYCFAATVRPAQVLQVGAGVSTAVLLRAASEQGFEMQLTCVDPFPTAYLEEQAGKGAIELIAAPAESLPAERLTGLRPGSLLFVDSTHAVRPGSDVNRIVLDGLPALAQGVFVHFHDVLLPYDYLPSVLDDDLFFWSESALLQAFLTDNRRVVLRVALSMLHHDAGDELRRILPTYRPVRQEQGIAVSEDGGEHFPSSAYLEVVA